MHHNQGTTLKSCHYALYNRFLSMHSSEPLSNVSSQSRLKKLKTLKTPKSCNYVIVWSFDMTSWDGRKGILDFRARRGCGGWVGRPSTDFKSHSSLSHEVEKYNLCATAAKAEYMFASGSRSLFISLISEFRKHWSISC